MSAIDNVSPSVWRNMCAESAELLARASSYRSRGLHSEADRIWRELRPLNRRIRQLALRPPDGS